MVAFVRRLGPWLLALVALYWLALFAGTHYPHFGAHLEDGTDKVLHFLAYCGLALLLAVAMAARGKRTSTSTADSCSESATPTSRSNAAIALRVLAILAVYGVIDELSQIPVGRNCDWRDWCADMLGALTGLALFKLGRGLVHRYARHAEADEPPAKPLVVPRRAVAPVGD